MIKKITSNYYMIQIYKYNYNLKINNIVLKYVINSYSHIFRVKFLYYKAIISPTKAIHSCVWCEFGCLPTES